MNKLTFHFETDVKRELERARAKFPTNEHKGHALTEESGEVITALLEHKYGVGCALDVYKECVQAAAMAQRVAEEGDADFPYTREKAIEDDAWAMEDTAWAKDRSVDTRILADGMMSAIRFAHPNGTRYQTEMRRLCNFIDMATQQQKDEACLTSPNNTDASPLNDAANGAVSVGTSTSSIKSSAQTDQIALSASARTTTHANAKGASATRTAQRVAKR